jgi:hypothetical protein
VSLADSVATVTSNPARWLGLDPPPASSIHFRWDDEKRITVLETTLGGGTVFRHRDETEIFLAEH